MQISHEPTFEIRVQFDIKQLAIQKYNANFYRN
jgi:hypothetical protein